MAPPRAVADADDAGSAASSGLNGRASHPRNPQTKRADSSVLSPTEMREGQLPVARRPVHRHVRRLAHAGRARHHVPVALREDDDVAGRRRIGVPPWTVAQQLPCVITW